MTSGWRGGPRGAPSAPLGTPRSSPSSSRPGGAAARRASGAAPPGRGVQAQSRTRDGVHARPRDAASPQRARSPPGHVRPHVVVHVLPRWQPGRDCGRSGRPDLGWADASPAVHAAPRLRGLSDRLRPRWRLARHLGLDLREHVDSLVHGIVTRLGGESARDPAHDPIEDGHHVGAGGHRVEREHQPVLIVDEHPVGHEQVEVRSRPDFCLPRRPRWTWITRWPRSTSTHARCSASSSRRPVPTRSALLGPLFALYETATPRSTPTLMLRYVTDDRTYLGIGHRMIPIQPPTPSAGSTSRASTSCTSSSSSGSSGGTTTASRSRWRSTAMRRGRSAATTAGSPRAISATRPR